ncbi:rho GDP-dissociation inhibitor, partial [Klebsiella pneumoniae]|nr:rho GDP-dissociation inhibitor [Klebsiella pneumoniae]
SPQVNREIVSGMKYIQHTYRKGVKIDKTDYMVGSYGPRAEEYEFLTPMEEAPKRHACSGATNLCSANQEVREFRLETHRFEI